MAVSTVHPGGLSGACLAMVMVSAADSPFSNIARCSSSRIGSGALWSARYGLAHGMGAGPIPIRSCVVEPRASPQGPATSARPRGAAYKGLCYFGNWSAQSAGSSIMYISTSSVPERLQLLVKSTRVKPEFTLEWGSAQ